MCRTKHAVLECRRSKALLKQVVNEAAGEKIPEAYFLEYVEDFSRPRTKLGDSRNLVACSNCFSSKAAGSLDAEAYLSRASRWANE